MYRLLLIALSLILAPVAALSATNDLSIRASDITFSSKTLVAGDRIRLYAQIRNVGTEDMAGYVSFFQGTIPIGDSQVISVREGGVPEDVFVDFTVPAGSFNIRAEIKGTDPQDTNASNDVAVTGLFTPIADQDHDGIVDDKDNCVAKKNADQKDTDKDGQGDACDEDDDDDGLSDDVEKEIGTNPLRKDTDGDGVPDKDDAFPTDPTKTKEPPPAPPPAPAAIPAKPAPVAPAPPQASAIAAPVLAPAAEAPVEPSAQDASVPDAGVGMISAVFSLDRLDWNRFSAEALTPDLPGYRFQWDFGDGVTSNQHALEHEYDASGSYRIRLTVTDPDGRETKDETQVRVPFFNLGNPLMKAAVALLGVLLLCGIFALVRTTFAVHKERDYELAIDLPEAIRPAEPAKAPRKLFVRHED